MAKRYLLVLSLALLTANSAWAAFSVAPALGYRMNNGTIEDSTGTSISGDTGFQYGALVYFGFDEMFALRSGLLMADRSVKVKQSSPLGDYNMKYKLSYLDIPLNVQVWVPATGLYFFGGIIFSSKSSNSCETVSGPTAFTCTSEIASSNNIVNLGLGYDTVDLGVGKLAFEAQYEHGLSNISSAGGNTKIYTRGGIAISALWRVGI